LAIAYILPVIVPLWKLTPPEVGFLISAGAAGQLVGALVFGWIAERYGRINALIGAIATYALLSLACAFSWDYASLLILRTIQGFGLGGEVPVAATYINELSKAKGRGRFVLLFELVFPTGILAASLLSLWIVPNLGWQYMFVVGVIPALAVFFLQRLLPESPRWLATRGRYADAEVALRVVEKGTERAYGRPLPPPQMSVAAVEKKPSWTDLFGPTYLKRTLVVWVLWFATYFVNYGLQTWMPTVYSTVFHLPLGTSLRYQLFTNVLGLCSSATCAMLIDLTGRRRWFVVGFALSATALLFLWYSGPDTATRVWLLGTLSYMCVATLSLAVYLYTPELYPTRSRALAVGTATAWLRLATMIAPTIVGYLLDGGGLRFVFLTFGLVGLAAAIIVGSFAIETKGRVLEEISP
ncbi:MAG TPA: MFS transporter, partial [Micropepsaceae bacterium]|nr:MFS transporter [Micropepsaceae bacterium]